MMRSIVLSFLLIIYYDGCYSGDNKQPAAAQSILEKKNDWMPYFQENAVNALLLEASQKHQPSTVAFINVNVISMENTSVRNNQTVVIENGKFTAIGNSNKVTIPPNATKVDGTGQYLFPGLTDMHIHSLVSNSQKLLNLACGVTTVRDMCGFPWLLNERDMIAKNKMLGPTVYQAGQILNYFSMDYYARVVKTAAEARAAVREHKQAGYDFIKIHNNMPMDIYTAVCDEAKQLLIDVVGHIPHQVKLEDAIALGQRTFEHMKGYYSDRTLEMTTEEYLNLTGSADAWNCPTFYTRRIGFSKSDVMALLKTEEVRYAPALDREQWLTSAPEKSNEVNEKIFSQSKMVFKNLLTVGAKFVAGTDCGGGYNNMVPGFALFDELETMENLGMKTFEVLQATTVNAAQSMRKEHAFGMIAIGKRADCALLPKNPLETVRNLRSNNGIMARGIWLSKKDINTMLSRIAGVYADTFSVSESDPVAGVSEMIAAYIDLRARGFHGRRETAGNLGEMLINIGMINEAIRIFTFQKEDFPTSVDPYLNLADAYMKTDQPSMALQECESVLRLDPKNEKASLMKNMLQKK